MLLSRVEGAIDGGGVLPGAQIRMEHQLRCGSKRLLFRGFPSTPLGNMGIISSSVYLSKWCTLLLLLSMSTIRLEGGLFTIGEAMMLGI